jgi:hypothetical protein
MRAELRAAPRIRPGELFNADADRYIISFADSWPLGTHFRHPLIEFTFSLPIRAAARVMCAVAACDRAALRHDLALLVIPMAEAVKGALVYWVCVTLGLTLWQAALLCALNLFSLSTLTVGSVPETFAISSMLITGFIALMVGVFHSRRVARSISWVAVGSLAIGITVTNVMWNRGVSSGLHRRSLMRLLITFSLAAS